MERRQVTSGECALHAWRLGAQPVQRSLEGRCMQPGHEDPGTRGPRGESLWGIRSGGREGRTTGHRPGVVDWPLGSWRDS